jgi:hypothetical protein
LEKSAFKAIIPKITIKFIPYWWKLEEVTTKYFLDPPKIKSWILDFSTNVSTIKQQRNMDPNQELAKKLISNGHNLVLTGM